MDNNNHKNLELAQRQLAEEESINLVEIIKIIRINLLPIIIAIITGTLVAGYIAMSRPNMYKSTALIRIKQKQNNILENPFLQEFGPKSTYILNEIEVMKTYSFREKVYDALMDTFKYNEIGNYSLITIHDEDDKVILAKKESIIKSLSNSVEINQKKDLEIVEISTSSASPSETALICNLYVQQYENENMRLNREQLTNVREFLKNQVDSKFDELVEVETNLSDFQEQGGIISLDEQASQIIVRISEIEARKNELQIDLAISNQNLEMLNAELKEKEPSVAEYIENFQTEKYVEELQSEIAKYEVSRDVAVSGMGSVSDSKVLIEGYNSKLAELKQILNQHLNKIKNNIYASTREELRELVSKILAEKIKYQSFLSSRKEIDEILSKYNDKFEKLPKTSISFARLQRDREVKERLYILVQEKYQEALVNEQAVPANVLILDPARKALYPFAPNRPMIIIVGLLVGAALSIGVILARHFMSGSVITPEDIQKIGLKVVAWIPKIGFIGGKNEVKKEFVVFSNPSSNNAEAFRALRTRVMFMKSKEGKSVQTIVLTSSSPREGKTLVATNLAGSFAQSGKKTLIMDCDLRKPRVHKIFDVQRSPGLTDYFVRQAELEDIILKTDMKNLDFIPAGKIPVNPAEILGSVLMEKTLNQFKEKYDVIVLDSPPVISVTDAEILACFADATFLVVKSEETDKESLQKAAEIITHNNTNFAGTILNDFMIRKEYGSYYKYYYYYYADASDKVKRKLHVDID